MSAYRTLARICILIVTVIPYIISLLLMICNGKGPSLKLLRSIVRLLVRHDGADAQQMPSRSNCMAYL